MGVTVIDAGVLIAFLDSTDAHHAAARRALADASERGDVVTFPASAYAESLVGPARQGDAALALIRAFVQRLPIRVVPLDTAIAEAAARLRARHGQRMRLPDALVVATAIALDADLLVTTDRGWPRRTTLGLRGQIAYL